MRRLVVVAVVTGLLGSVPAVLAAPAGGTMKLTLRLHRGQISHKCSARHPASATVYSVIGVRVGRYLISSLPQDSPLELDYAGRGTLVVLTTKPGNAPMCAQTMSWNRGVTTVTVTLSISQGST